MLSNCSARGLLRVPWTARRSNQSIPKEIHPEYSLKGPVLKAKPQYFGHLMQRTNSLEDPEAGKDWGQEKGATEDEMVEKTPVDSEGQGSLARCSPWGGTESDMTKSLNNNTTWEIIKTLMRPWTGVWEPGVKSPGKQSEGSLPAPQSLPHHHPYPGLTLGGSWISTGTLLGGSLRTEMLQAPPLGNPKWLSGKESACQYRRLRRCRFNPWVGKIPGEGHGNLHQYPCLGDPMDSRCTGS